MKQLFIVLVVGFSGCATVSDYNKGCKDGVRTWVLETLNASIEETILEKGCSNLESIREKPSNRDMSGIGRRH